MSKLPKEFNFPQAMKELEELNDYFASPDLDLTQALDKFQQAQELMQQCQLYLDQVQTKFAEITPETSENL